MAADTSRLINRELSWLEFNQRVLDEALEDGVPTLERLKFLSITSSNLDEFFMVRVGGLRALVAARRRRRDPAGFTPRQQLDAIGVRVRTMVRDQYRCFSDRLEPALAEAGIVRVHPDAIDAAELEHVHRIFEEAVYPVISPMALHAGTEFPVLRGLSLHLLVRLAPIEPGRDFRHVVIPIGLGLNRFPRLPAPAGIRFMLIEDLVSIFVGQCFPAEQVLECCPFRITRNADLSVEEDLAPDLLTGMEEVLAARKTSDCVRLEVDDRCSADLLRLLMTELHVGTEEVYRVSGPIDLSAFMDWGGVRGFDEWKYEPWTPQPSPDVDPAASMFEVLAGKDVLLCHPFDTFDPVVRLIDEAADDPDVLAIKQILYRTSRNSPIVAALMRAAERGKYVTAIVELKARFDEARNIEWARTLEQAGAQVIYGIKGLKTHAKVCIIVRREDDGLKRYLHFGTGNYNESTAKLYTDISYMTCNENLATEASMFFNTITGYSQPQTYHVIQAAPYSLRDTLIELIEAETERKRQGQKAEITIKVNSLADPVLIEALYRASEVGVKIRLIVRGICCLRPGVPGLSERIRVVSIVDRFLEHSRILYFYHGGDERMYISSADWMRRNLDRRVELLVPVEDARCKKRIAEVLQATLADSSKARLLRSDGTYERVLPPRGRPGSRSQETLYRQARDAVAHSARHETRFEPHRPPETGIR